MECSNCRHNRQLKVGEKVVNATRRGNYAFCNECGKLVATYYVKD